MDDQSLLRYSRQIMLPQIDIEGQRKLLDAHVLILGLGGLGSVAAMYLASAGVGKLTLIDFDEVDLSNLQRQIIHHTDDIGKSKVASAKETLIKLNPEVDVQCISKKLKPSELAPYLETVDCALDCSDNFQARYALNELCFHLGVPLVSGAAIALQGQISVFDFRQEDSPCYQCLYPNRAAEEHNQSCAENGVLGPVVGTIASMQALEAIKILLNIGNTLCGRLLIFDGLYSEWKELKLQRDQHCATCGQDKK